MKSPIDVLVDFGFKRVFGSEMTKDLGVALINALIDFPENQQVKTLDLLNPFSDTDFEREKTSIYDIKARDQLGRLLNLEVQMWWQYFFLPRMFYYSTKNFSQQLEEGQGYDKLHTSHGVYILNAKEFDDDEYYRCAGVTNLATGELIIDQFFMHFIEVPKFKLKLEELQTPREIWTYFLKHSTSLDTENLPIQLTSQPIKKALEVLIMLSQDQKERMLYEDRIKARRDHDANVLGARLQQEALEAALKAASEREKALEAARLEREKALEVEREKARLEREKARLEREKARLDREKAEKTLLIGMIEFTQGLLKETLAPRAELEGCSVQELQSRLAALQQRLAPSA
jgi:predicted transposase/invertase (TIGR01784 family)